MDHILSLAEVSKKYGDVTAVDALSLDISRGEFVTLLGPSGSGKTTTLMMIAGFETPDAGQIYLDGEMVSYKPPHKRNIGMAFQSYALFPHMTISENIAFPLRMRHRPKAEIQQEVERTLEQVRLAGYGGRYPRQLSGGQQQRVALARALVYNPPVLLMDEPLGALDKKLREHMQLEIKHLHETIGITVIYVTHDQSEALTMSDRIALMNEGRIEQIGTPTELYERPVNHFVADFIGDTNLLSEMEVAGLKDGSLNLVCASGLKLDMPAGDDEPPAKLSLAIRPERIAILSGEEQRDQVFKGLVEEVVYLGDTYRYCVLLEGCQQVTVNIKNDRTGPLLQKGQMVRVGWNHKDVNLL